MKYLKKFESVDDSISRLSGWVNVKIDEQLFIRVAKYVNALDTLLDDQRHKYDLYKKLEILSKVDTRLNSSVNIQTKIAVITLLQYINEIKGQFNPSSAGFLLEGFLAALIHGKKVSGNKAADITGRQTPNEQTNSLPEDDYVDKNYLETSYKDLEAVNFETESPDNLNKVTYQIKLYKKGNSIKIKMGKDATGKNRVCDYYVICLKDGNSKNSPIDVHILTPGNSNLTYEQNKSLDNSFIGQYATKIRGGGNAYMRKTKTKNKIQYIELNTNSLASHTYKVTLKTDDNTINNLIFKCAESVKDSIENVYSHLSELHYDVDSLVSGYSKNKTRISSAEAKINTDITLKKISDEINKLESDISRS
jgi:hypothetical protein